MALPIDTEGHGHRRHADAVERTVLDDDLAGGLVDLPDRAVAQRRGLGSGRRAGVVIVLLAAAAYFLLPGSLNALRDDTQSLIDGMARKDEAAPAVAPPPSEPASPPGASNEQIIAPQAVVAGEPAATTNNEATASDEEIMAMHHAAHEECFIAHSILAEVVCTPVAR